MNAQVVKSISGHSMRVGGAQDLLIHGASMPQIMVKGGSAKTYTVIRYVERVRGRCRHILRNRPTLIDSMLET